MSSAGDVYAVTQLMDCGIKTVGQTSSTFSEEKSGRVRLVRSDWRRSYLVQLSLKHSPPDKIELEIELPDKSRLNLQSKNLVVHINLTDGALIIKLRFNENKAYETFKDKLSKCIQDPNLQDDSLLIEKPVKTSRKVNQAQFSPPPRPPLPAKSVEIPEIHQNPIVPVVALKNDQNQTTQKSGNSGSGSIAAKLAPAPFYKCDPSAKTFHKASGDVEIIRDMSNLTSRTTNGSSAVKRPRENMNAPIHTLYNRENLACYAPDPSSLDNVDLPAKRADSPRPPIGALSTKQRSFRPNHKKAADVYEFKENKSCSPYTWNTRNDISKATRLSALSISASSSSSSSNTKGFLNLGNTCYMNAILQCIVNIDLFSNELISNFDIVNELQKLEASERDKKSENGSESSDGGGASTTESKSVKVPDRSLYMCMCELLKTRGETLMTDKVKKSLEQIKHAIAQEDKNFSGWEQHDAHEFLCVLLEMIRANVEAFNKKYQDRKAVVRKSLAESKKEASLMVEELTNPVLDNFQFKVEHSIECQTCKQVTTNEEEYLSLGLRLSQKAKLQLQTGAGFTLQDALDEFFREETVTDFKCQSCDEIKEVIIRRRFVKLPRILVLYLIRYECSLNEETNVYKFRKLDNQVRLPSLVTIEHLLVPDLTKVQSPKQVNKALMDEQNRVKLETKQAKMDDVLVTFATTPAATTTTTTTTTTATSSLLLPVAAPKTPQSVKKQPLGNISNRSNVKDSPLFTNKLATPPPTKSRIDKECRKRLIEEDDNGSAELPDIIDPFVDDEEANIRLAMELSLKDEEQKEQLRKKEEEEAIASVMCLDLPTTTADKNKFKFGCDGAADSPEMTEDESSNDDVPVKLEKSKAAESIFGKSKDPATYADNPRMKKIAENANKTTTRQRANIFTNPYPVISNYFREARNNNKGACYNEIFEVMSDNDGDEDYKELDRCKKRKRTSQEIQAAEKKKSVSPPRAEPTSAELEVLRVLEMSKKSYEEEQAKQSLINQEFDEDLKKALQQSSLEAPAAVMVTNIPSSEEMEEDDDQQEVRIIKEERVVSPDDPYAYRIIGIVNHLGASSSSGHYISDVFNTKTQTWSSYDDTQVSSISESDVLKKRQRSGYIFFYLNNSILKDN